jgi:hypothetical protein
MLDDPDGLLAEHVGGVLRGVDLLLGQLTPPLPEVELPTATVLQEQQRKSYSSQG